MITKDALTETFIDDVLDRLRPYYNDAVKSGCEDNFDTWCFRNLALVGFAFYEEAGTFLGGEIE